jgi:hypothetical protein
MIAWISVIRMTNIPFFRGDEQLPVLPLVMFVWFTNFRGIRKTPGRRTRLAAECRELSVLCHQFRGVETHFAFMQTRLGRGIERLLHAKSKKRCGCGFAGESQCKVDRPLNGLQR